MASSAANEKKQDERRIKELRDFQRSNSANKRCFDCNEMMPQYVCLDFNTFICTQCSGIHREFAHRIKSISMSKFTDTEVKNMIKFGGNETAQKYWRARHDINFRPSGVNDGERIRNFIRLTYIDRKWVYESPRESKRNRDEPQSSAKKNSFGSGDNDFFGSSSSNTPSFDAFGSNDSSSGGGGFGHFADFSSGGSSNKKQSNDFDDFGNFGGSSSSHSGAGGGFGDFGDFGDQKPAARTNSRTSSASKEYLSGSFKLAPPPGSNFTSSTTTSSTTDFFGDSSSTSNKPAATPAQATHDFLAFSPDKQVADPFGFSSGGATNTPTAAGGQRPSSSSFDAFGEVSGHRGSSSSFDAFGSSTTPSNSVKASPFDAFGATSSTPSAAAASASPFDAFGSASTPSASAGGRPSASSFDAFGAGNASNFGDFSSTPVSAPAKQNSFGGGAANSADPFGAFSPRGSATSAAPEPPKPAPAAPVDPFSAFDSMDANDSLSSSSTTVHVASSSSTANADPFAFADSSSSSTNANTNSSANTFGNNAFGASSTSAPSNPTGMGGFQGFGGPSHPTGCMPSGGMGGMGQMYNNNNAMFQQPPQPHQQQNMFGAPQQQMFGQTMAGATPGFPPMNAPHAPAPGQHIPQPQPDATASIKDPFASLNIGITPSSRKSASTSSSSHSSMSSFSTTPHTNPSPPSQPFGGFQAVPAANNSRGDSFDMGGGFPAPTPTQSSNSPFGFAAPVAASHPPVKSNSMDAFSDFGSFGSATPAAANKTASSGGLVPPPAATPPAAAASANPFDMF